MVSSAACPIAHGTKRQHDGIVCSQKKNRGSVLRPILPVRLPPHMFISNPLDTRDRTGAILFHQPNPRGRAEIEAIVQILGLDEHIRTDKIGGHSTTPTSRPRSWKVSVFLTPNILNASR